MALILISLMGNRLPSGGATAAAEGDEEWTMVAKPRSIELPFDAWREIAIRGGEWVAYLLTMVSKDTRAAVALWELKPGDWGWASHIARYRDITKLTHSQLTWDHTRGAAVAGNIPNLAHCLKMIWPGTGNREEFRHIATTFGIGSMNQTTLDWIKQQWGPRSYIHLTDEELCLLMKRSQLVKGTRGPVFDLAAKTVMWPTPEHNSMKKLFLTAIGTGDVDIVAHRFFRFAKAWDPLWEGTMHTMPALIRLRNADRMIEILAWMYENGGFPRELQLELFLYLRPNRHAVLLTALAEIDWFGDKKPTFEETTWYLKESRNWDHYGHRRHYQPNWHGAEA